MGLGDQVYVFRPWLNLEGLYEHHGIDCGDGSIIHYRKPSETVERTSRETFSLGNPVYSLELGQRFCFVPQTVVDRAQSRLGERKYNLLFNNCEHFASWCKTGISESRQVRQFLSLSDHFPFGSLGDSLNTALQDTDPKNAQRLLQEALGNLRQSWDQLQPQYKLIQAEIETWQRVAQKALAQNREDLAIAALHKKRLYQHQQETLQTQLNEVAKLTETILQDLLKSQSKSF